MRPSKPARLLALLALSGGVAAQGPIDDKAPLEAVAATPLARVQGLIEEYEKERAAFFEAYRAAEDQEQAQQVFEELYPDGDAYAAEMLTVAEARPGGEAQRAAVRFALENGGSASVTERALAAMAAHFPNEVEFALMLSYTQLSPAAVAHAQTILEVSESAQVRGNVLMALAENAKSIAGVVRGLHDEPEEGALAYYVDAFGEEYVAELRSSEPASFEQRAAAYYGRVLAEYADVESRSGTLGERAERDLFELQNLSIGKVAPEIEGEDVDGVAFKLSDYRGKVVVLDFWGDW